MMAVLYMQRDGFMIQSQTKIGKEEGINCWRMCGLSTKELLHGDAGSKINNAKETSHTSVLLPGPVGKASLGRILNTLPAIAG